MGSGESDRMFKEEISAALYVLFQKVEAEGALPDSPCEARTSLIPKSDKHITGKENRRPMSLMKIDVN